MLVYPVLALIFGAAFAQSADPAPTNAPAAGEAAAPAGPAKGSAEAALNKLKKKYGDNCLYEVDHELKLAFATTADRHTMDELKERLTAFAKALRRDLFQHGLEEYCAVAVPKKWPGTNVGGHYWPGWVDARTIGPTLLHEFTHALHFADQGPRDQFHNVWVIEGLAGLFEYSKIVDGHIVPRHNHQLYNVREDLHLKKNVPWAKMVKFERRQFHSIHYAQARYMMFYLFDKGVLKKWYDAYCEGFKDDPSGGAALEKVLGKTLEEIDRDWVAWIEALPLPPLPQAGSPSLGILHSQIADGLEITGFAPGSAAAKAGLKAGDIVVRVNGDRIIEREELMDAVLRHKVGDTIKVQYRRDEKYVDVDVTLAPLVLPPPEAPAQP